jgi:hypothetical protein
MTVRFIPVELPEPERRWRREQILRVLSEILRNPGASKERQP